MIVPSKPERKTLQKIAFEDSVLGLNWWSKVGGDEPAWIQIKPWPRDDADHIGPDLTDASSTDRSESNELVSSSAESAWISTSPLLAIDDDTDFA